jgi:hypothetical protein
LNPVNATTSKKRLSIPNIFVSNGKRENTVSCVRMKVREKERKRERKKERERERERKREI